MKVLSGILVVAFAVFLTGLSVLIAAKPQLAERFLRSFASSAPAHYAEQSLRLIVRGAMASFAPSMWYPHVFMLAGMDASRSRLPRYYFSRGDGIMNSASGQCRS